MLKKMCIAMLALMCLVSLTACGLSASLEMPTGQTSVTHGPTDDPAKDPTEDLDTAPTVTEDMLVGDWTGWCGEKETTIGMELYRCIHISFLEDGTFTDYEASYAIQENGEYMYMVTPHVYGGNYTVEGDVLTLNYTYFNSGAPDEEGKTTTTNHKISVIDGVMQIEDFGYYRRFPTLYKGLSVAEVIAMKQSEERGIVGIWKSVYRREDNAILTRTLIFNEDGTCSYDDYGYYHSQYVPVEGESGWYVMPMGWPTNYGTYTFDGEEIVLTTVNDYECESVLVLQVESLEQIGEGKLLIKDEYGTYLSASVYPDTDTWELCVLLGVDTTAE